MVKKCKFCGSDFVPSKFRKNTQIFCTSFCRHNFHNRKKKKAPLEKRNCKCCGAELPLSRHYRLYCDKCAVMVQREQSAEWHRRRSGVASLRRACNLPTESRLAKKKHLAAEKELSALYKSEMRKLHIQYGKYMSLIYLGNSPEQIRQMKSEGLIR